MPQRRRKKPPDETLVCSAPFLWLRPAYHSDLPHPLSDLPHPLCRPFPDRRDLRDVVGDWLICSLISFSLQATETTVPPLFARVVLCPISLTRDSTDYCSSVWWLCMGHIDKVGVVALPHPVTRSRLDQIRYRTVHFSLIPQSDQVWASPLLSLWVYLLLQSVLVFRWWCDYWSTFRSFLTVVWFVLSDTSVGWLYCGSVQSSWCMINACPCFFAIYIVSQFDLGVHSLWLIWLAGVSFTMPSPPPPVSSTLEPNVTTLPRARPGASPVLSTLNSEGDCSLNHAPLPAASYSEALILGGGSQTHPSGLPSDGPSCETTPPTTQSEGMSSLCLLGKPWGEPIPLSIIISKTRKDWSFLKGQLDYVELGNGWLLFRFSNLPDINLVWNGRPWHVSGLNLVLRRWEPFFDPYSATIQRIDQWVKITRLPLELWEEEYLKHLLQDVGHFLKIDDITLNRSKGKFARVCLNIDISKPLRGSLFLPIPNQSRPLEVPISYEGLHEVCAWCGSNAHELDACPETPKGPMEVIVEKFGAAKLQNDSQSSPLPSSASPPLTEKWVTVSPRKRGRSSPFARRKPPSKLSSIPASPAVKIVTVGSASDNVIGAGNQAGSIPASTGVGPPTGSYPSLTPPSELNPPVDATHIPTVTGAASDVHSPRDSANLSPGSHHPAHSSPASPLSDSVMNEEDVDMFLNFEPEDDVQLSPDSSKKRKLTAGEASSPSSSTK